MIQATRHNWPIHRRLLIIFVLAAVIPACLLALVGYLDGTMLQTQARALMQVNDANAALNQGTVALQEMNADLRAHVLASEAGDVAGDAGLEADIYTRERTFGDDLQHYQQAYLLISPADALDANVVLRRHGYIALIDQQARRFAQVQADWNAYRTQQNAVLRALSHGQISTALAGEQQANISFATLQSSWTSLSQIDGAVARAVGTALTQDNQTATVRAVLLALGILLLMALLGTYVARSITRPLRTLAEFTRSIAGGDMTRRAPTFGRDEIGAVAASMNAMLDSIVDLLRQTQQQRDHLQGQVEKLVSEVSGIAEGDLRLRVAVTNDALGVLAQSFNYVIDELGALVHRVQETARAVQQATIAVRARSAQLVASAQQEAQQIASARLLAQQMTQANVLLVGGAQTLAKTAQQLQQEAREGHSAMQEAATGAEQTHNQVQKVVRQARQLRDWAFAADALIRSMGDNAHQTNRLALDAAIQAAMAGESGRGFGAVVADIRRLSEEAKERGTEIARLAAHMAANTQEEAETVDEVARQALVNVATTRQIDDTLASIDELAGQHAALIEHIQRLSNDQAARMSAVADAMVSVTDLIGRTAEDAASVARAVAQQAALVERLRASVDAVKVNEPPLDDHEQQTGGIHSGLWPQHMEPGLASAPAQSRPIGVTSGMWLPQGHPGNGLLAKKRSQ
jgi:methyl-accepting chemotaxis protein